ncbi:hypothetical protein [Lactococcus cremoris]
MKKIILLGVLIFVLFPLALWLDWFNINEFLNQYIMITKYLKVVLPMLLPTAALLLTLSRYRKDDIQRLTDEQKKEEKKEEERNKRIQEETLRKKEAARPYFSVKSFELSVKKLQVFTSDGSPTLNVKVIYSRDREKIYDKGGMENSEIIDLIDEPFDWILLNANSVRGENIYFVFTSDTLTGAHYIEQGKKLTEYSTNDSGYERAIVENYLDFTTVRAEYTKNKLIGNFHDDVSNKKYNEALSKLVIALREEKDISKSEKISLLSLLYLFIDQSRYTIQENFDRYYAKSKSGNFNGIDWSERFMDERQEINSNFLAYYILDILDAFQKNESLILDYILRPIEGFVRDDIVIHDNDSFVIRQMEKLLLGNRYEQEYAFGLLKDYPFRALENMKSRKK